MPIDHTGFKVADLAASTAFYQQALAPLSISLLFTVTPEMSGGGTHAGFGAGGRSFFWIGDGETASGPVHIAFVAPSRAAVDAFYAAALATGVRDNGAPGLRPHYHPDYYGAFVLDPDGNNIEAVCRLPP